jgi:hypothetical protein
MELVGSCGCICSHTTQLTYDGRQIETCTSAFNVNFNVSFDILLEQFNCAFRWINKGLDNVKMDGTNVNIVANIFY